MTCGERGLVQGRLVTVAAEIEESAVEADDLVALMTSWTGRILPDLSIGADVAGAVALRANERLCSVGMKTIGDAFQIDGSTARKLGLGEAPGAEKIIRRYLNGRDLASAPRGVYVIDLFGVSETDVRGNFPAVYQHLLTRAKPERDHNRNRIFRDFWWVIGHPRPQFRASTIGLRRYVATIETSKHRFLTFLPTDIVPDSTLVTFALDDAYFLGVLSSGVHVAWALAAGGRLGVGNDPRYNKTRCFETFPFPAPTDAQSARIRDIVEQLDAHRKRQQAQHPGFTLTGIYNVLEKLKAGEALNAKEKAIHEQGLVSVLKQLHDELDLAVLEAYGWSDLAPLMQVVNGNAAPATAGVATREDARRALDDALLTRLVALNAERAAEEKRGLVRWLRPEFQAPGEKPAPQQVEIEVGGEEIVAAAAERKPWPKDLPDQVRGVADVLTASRAPLSEHAIAAHFTGRGPWKRRLPQIVETLVSLGRARKVDGGRVLGAD